MHLPMKLLATVALLLPNTGVLARGPPGSGPPSAEDGPDKLEKCGCTKIANAIMKCQNIDWMKTKSQKEIRDCVCIPNSDRENAWYGYIHNCRACLSPGSYDINDFFDNFSRTLSQLMVSCTNAGGGVTADGNSICASNYYFEGCASLKPSSRDSWASYEVFGRNGDEAQKGNGTRTLNLVNPNGDDTDSDSDDEGNGVTTSSTALETSTTSAAEDAQTTTTQTQTETQEAGPTTETQTAATTAPAGSSAMAGAVIPGFMLALGLGVGTMML
ncbi:hypothetical protein QBC40DRAFT_287987 [Triangularia verruculosa]|uniref:Uncharacterized protein n=1 Tax=Triangularia verruculosa TaxID=2587418 RepID=A0AAN7AQW4_9PEZI|nr:hypothetical protein QBC40DRAFT_287987 [Triangularia verruculosa]